MSQIAQLILVTFCLFVVNSEAKLNCESVFKKEHPSYEFLRELARLQLKIQSTTKSERQHLVDKFEHEIKRQERLFKDVDEFINTYASLLKEEKRKHDEKLIRQKVENNKDSKSLDEDLVEELRDLKFDGEFNGPFDITKYFFTPDSKELVYYSHPFSISNLNLKSGVIKTRSIKSLIEPYVPSAMDLSPDGGRLALIVNGDLLLIDRENFELKHKLKNLFEKNTIQNKVIWSDSGNQLAIVSEKKIYVFKIENELLSLIYKKELNEHIVLSSLAWSESERFFKFALRSDSQNIILDLSDSSKELFLTAKNVIFGEKDTVVLAKEGSKKNIYDIEIKKDLFSGEVEKIITSEFMPVSLDRSKRYLVLKNENKIKILDLKTKFIVSSIFSENYVSNVFADIENNLIIYSELQYGSLVIQDINGKNLNNIKDFKGNPDLDFKFDGDLKKLLVISGLKIKLLHIFK